MFYMWGQRTFTKAMSNQKWLIIPWPIELWKQATLYLVFLSCKFYLYIYSCLMLFAFKCIECTQDEYFYLDLALNARFTHFIFSIMQVCSCWYCEPVVRLLKIHVTNGKLEPLFTYIIYFITILHNDFY